jgi:hypothetical protein
MNQNQDQGYPQPGAPPAYPGLQGEPGYYPEYDKRQPQQHQQQEQPIGFIQPGSQQNQQGTTTTVITNQPRNYTI